MEIADAHPAGNAAAALVPAAARAAHAHAQPRYEAWLAAGLLEAAERDNRALKNSVYDLSARLGAALRGAAGGAKMTVFPAMSSSRL